MPNLGLGEVNVTITIYYSELTLTKVHGDGSQIGLEAELISLKGATLSPMAKHGQSINAELTK